jgi:hypothetical protein
MVRSRRRCAPRGRRSCSALDAAGRTACRRSQRCTHAQAPLRKLRPALRESIHWLRKPSRFPLRPRQRRFRSGRAVGRRLRGEPVVQSSSGHWIGTCSSARRGGPSGKAKADAAGLRIFTRRSGAAVVADRPADRSWCTVGPLVGSAFGLVSDLSDLMHGSEGAHIHACTHAHTHTQV